MSLETLKDALEFYKKHGISHIILSGGELFEHPQIIECLELCAQYICTPTISPSGDIKLGESRLCPPVASIYDPEDVIIEKINSFGCKKCEIPFEILKEHSRTGYDMLTNI